jgi:hypothetical protein
MCIADRCVRLPPVKMQAARVQLRAWGRAPAVLPRLFSSTAYLKQDRPALTEVPLGDNRKTVDDVDPAERMQEQQSSGRKAFHAHQSGSLGFGFSPGGLLFS